MNWLDKFIVSERGQWDYPGYPTVVPTKNGEITMKGVPYPLFAMDETGYGGMIYPGGNYKFPGKMVYEIPMTGNNVFKTKEDFYRDLLLQTRNKYWPKRESKSFDLGFDSVLPRVGPGPIKMPTVKSSYTGIAMRQGGYVLPGSYVHELPLAKNGMSAPGPSKVIGGKLEISYDKDRNIYLRSLDSADWTKVEGDRAKEFRTKFAQYMPGYFDPAGNIKQISKKAAKEVGTKQQIIDDKPKYQEVPQQVESVQEIQEAPQSPLQQVAAGVPPMLAKSAAQPGFGDQILSGMGNPEKIKQTKLQSKYQTSPDYHVTPYSTVNQANKAYEKTIDYKLRYKNLNEYSTEDIPKIQEKLYNEGYLQKPEQIDLANFKTKEQVTELQKKLAQFGLIDMLGKDGVNGVLNKQTKDAAKRFNELNQTYKPGELDDMTKQAIKNFKSSTDAKNAMGLPIVNPKELYDPETGEPYIDQTYEAMTVFENSLKSKGYFLGDEGYDISESAASNPKVSFNFKLNPDPTTPFGMCAAYVNGTVCKDDVVGEEARDELGFKGSAWHMSENIQEKGGQLLYTGLPDRSSVNLNGKNEITGYLKSQLTSPEAQNQLRDIIGDGNMWGPTTKVKPGDVVNIFYEGSNYTEEAYNQTKPLNNRFFTTHVGIVKAGDDGTLYVEHNVHGNVEKDKLQDFADGKVKGNGKNRVSLISGITRPNYVDGVDNDARIPAAGIKYYQTEEGQFNPKGALANPGDYLGQVIAGEKTYKYLTTIEKNKDKLLKDIPISETEFGKLMRVARVIPTLETYGGDNAEEEKTIGYAIEKGLKDIVSEKSTGFTKLKDASNLGEDIRQNLYQNDDSQLTDPVKAALPTFYLLSKNYLYLKEVANRNNIDVTSDELAKLAGLSYNQSIGKVAGELVDKGSYQNYYNYRVKTATDPGGNFKYRKVMDLYDRQTMRDGGITAPGRFKNPEGNWVSKYANGGDISIPDLSRPNWLDKYQKGSQVNEPVNATWSDEFNSYMLPEATVIAEQPIQYKVPKPLPSGAISSVPFFESVLMAPAAAASLMRAAPMIGSALNTPIAGIPGATAGNALGALGATDALINRLPVIPGQLSRGEYMDAAVNAATGALDIYGANMVSPLFKGATRGIKSTYNPSEDDIIRGLLKNTQRDEIERMGRIKPVDMSPSQYPYSTSYPTLSKRDQLDLDSFTSGRWPNPALFWKRYNMKKYGVEHDKPIPIFHDSGMPTDFMSTAAPKGNMYRENQVLTQRARLLDPDVKAKFFENQAPAAEGRSSILQKMPKDYGNRITPENYEDFIKTVHGSTDYDLAKSTGKLPGNLGIGSYGKPGMVYSDAPLNNLGKDIINAHEKNHGVFAGTLSKEMSTDLLKPFGTNRVIPNYADKNQADEVLARMAQFKNAVGIGNNQTFTLGHLNLIRKNYANQFLDNGITEMLSKLKPGSFEERQFLKNMNKYAFGIAAPTAIGAAALQYNQGPKVVPAPDFRHGGWLEKYQGDTNGSSVRRDPNQPFFESQTEPGTYEAQYSQPEVTITPNWTEAELERNRLRDDYIAKDKKVWRHWYDKLGQDKDNVTKRANQFAYNKLAKQYLKGDKENLTPEQRKFIEKSEYANRLQPSIGSRFIEGVTNPGFNLETLSNLAAPLEYPTNLVRGAVKGEFKDALMGQTPSPYFVSSDLAGTSPTEAAIMSGLVDAGVDTGIGAVDVATPLFKSGKYINDKYLDVAEGANPFDYAWRSPAERFDPGVQTHDLYGYEIDNAMPLSKEHFDKIKGLTDLTEDEKYILKQYELDSGPFTGRRSPVDPIKRAQLDNILKRAEVYTDEPLVMSRRIKAGSPDLFNLENGVYRPGRPTSWSAGRDAVGDQSYSGGADRMVMKLPKGKNRVLKNPYEDLSPEQYKKYEDELRQRFSIPEGSDSEGINHHMSMFSRKRPEERELLLDPYVNLKKMGKVKNSFGGYDYIMKPKFSDELSESSNRMGPGPMMLGLSRYPHEVKNVDYFKKMLDSYGSNKLSNQSKKYFEGIINSVRKQEGLATKKQYDMLQRLRSGDFNYGKKQYGGWLNRYQDGSQVESIDKWAGKEMSEDLKRIWNLKDPSFTRPSNYGEYTPKFGWSRGSMTPEERAYEKEYQNWKYSQIPQSWKDKYDWTPNVEEEYLQFKNDPNAPENLRFTDDMKDYNTRGMWDSLDKPSNWQQALDLFKQQQGYDWTPEEDGYYHAWSQHPGTGEWLKPRHHSTGWMNYMGYAFDPENTVVVNPEGFFGNETLQAYPKQKKKDGGQSQGEGYYDYINGYSGIFAKGGVSSKQSSWLNKYK